MARDTDFICRDTDLAALENLIGFLKEGGELVIVLPSRIAFGVGSIEERRIGVRAISDITDTGIDYSHIDRIDAQDRKIGKYLLEDGDVLVSTRGTTIKVAVAGESWNKIREEVQDNLFYCD